MDMDSLSLKNNLYATQNRWSQIGGALSVIQLHHLRHYLHVRIMDMLYAKINWNPFGLGRYAAENMIRFSFCRMVRHSKSNDFRTT